VKEVDSIGGQKIRSNNRCWIAKHFSAEMNRSSACFVGTSSHRAFSKNKQKNLSMGMMLDGPILKEQNPQYLRPTFRNAVGCDVYDTPPRRVRRPFFVRRMIAWIARALSIHTSDNA
jgi:hypothetical protein